MDKQQLPRITHWALIIGINHYPDPREKLRGSVNDADIMEKYLELSIGEKLDVVSLTATVPETLPGPPLEEPQSLPTHSNIVAHLERIADEAKPGDRVIIYFAGHGTYISGSTPALTILAKSGTAKQYFRMGALYRRVEVLIAKDLAVTVILDCCFSGAIVRGDDENVKVRCLDFDPTVSISPEISISNSDDPGETRDVDMDFDWLKYATNLVVLCACAPSERTFETLQTGKMQGVFTHHLLHALHALVKNGMSVTHVAVHEHLGTSLHADWPRQTPMRYGKANDVLFGESLLAPEQTSIPLYMKANGALCLRAGEVHGIVKGDEFHASLTNNDLAAPRIANVRATVVRAVESDLAVIEGRFKTAREASSHGWKAETLSSLSPRVLSVGIPPGLVNMESVPKESFRYLRLVDRQHDAINQREDSCLYNVIENANNQYEIVDAIMERVPLIPAIGRKLNDAPHQVVRVLRHIAEFKYFEGLENRLPCPRLQASFHVSCNIPTGSSNKIDVMRNDKVKFTFKNTGNEQLYIFAFAFGPTWKMDALCSQGFKILPARQGDNEGTLKVVMRTKWPEDVPAVPDRHCEDHIKFLITNEATHFRWSLPTISKTLEGPQDSYRGDSNGLHASLAEFFGGFRDERSGKWTTQSFFIRTRVEEVISDPQQKLI